MVKTEHMQMSDCLTVPFAATTHIIAFKLPTETVRLIYSLATVYLHFGEYYAL